MPITQLAEQYLAARRGAGQAPGPIVARAVGDVPVQGLCRAARRPPLAGLTSKTCLDDPKPVLDYDEATAALLESDVLAMKVVGVECHLHAAVGATDARNRQRAVDFG